MSHKAHKSQLTSCSAGAAACEQLLSIGAATVVFLELLYYILLSTCFLSFDTTPATVMEEVDAALAHAAQATVVRLDL